MFMCLYLIMAISQLQSFPCFSRSSDFVKYHMRVRKCCDAVCRSGGYLALITIDVNVLLLFLIAHLQEHD